MEILQKIVYTSVYNLLNMSTVLKDRSKFRPRTCNEGLQREYRCICTVCVQVQLYCLFNGGWEVISTL